MRHAAQPPADNRFVVAQRGERLDIEELDAAGLKQGGEVDRSVVGRENKRMQPGHLAGVERLLKFRGLSFFLCPVKFPLSIPSRSVCSIDAKIWSRRFASWRCC